MDREFETAVEYWAKREPAIWNYCYPKFYTGTEKYISARIVATAFFMSAMDCLKLAGPDASVTEIATLASLVKMKKFGLPMLFIAPELLAAVSKSEPPEQMRWDTMPKPFDGAVFMLPRGALTHPVNGEVAWLGYAHIGKGERLQASQINYNAVNERECFTVIWNCHEESRPPGFHVNLVADFNPFISRTAIKDSLGQASNDQSFLQIPMAESENEFGELATSLVFRLIMAMVARPGLVEKGKFTGKKLKSGTEIWTPNVIGRTFTIRREAADGEGGWSLRMHWRRGHFKEHAHGPQLTLRKTIWIEPYMAGGKSES